MGAVTVQQYDVPLVNFVSTYDVAALIWATGALGPPLEPR
jgi:hypothetical protein